MSERRVVITGMGALSPVGNDIATIWNNLEAGVSGIGKITSFDTTNFPIDINGSIKDFNPEPHLN
ncbi:MAG: beta-ketoacyl synthase N-terminal-like domain-containing protein, partial [Gammaproteobacteria bacterium]